MKNINTVKVVKVISLAGSIIGTFATAWVTKKENELTLAKLVDEHVILEHIPFGTMKEHWLINQAKSVQTKT